MHPYFDIPRPHLFGHRGASGEAPENTLPAFTRALAHGVPYLELDCHATRDGEIVVLHDAELARTTDGQGPVSRALLRRARAPRRGLSLHARRRTRSRFAARGVRVPRFAEVLAAFPGARLNLEVKQAEPPIAERGRAPGPARERRRGACCSAAEDEPILAEIARARSGHRARLVDSWT